MTISAPLTKLDSSLARYKIMPCRAIRPHLPSTAPANDAELRWLVELLEELSPSNARLALFYIDMFL